MPYANREDMLKNKREYYQKHKDIERMFSLERFRKMGLEPLDINDPTSDLECEFCGKVTRRAKPFKERHYEDCIYADGPFFGAKTPRGIVHSA